jgi:hypothetical protein
VIGRDSLDEHLQTVDAEAVSEGNPKIGEFPFIIFSIFLFHLHGFLGTLTRNISFI